jgi:type IV secretory pathway TraG/TraD family ATPase VirD4
MNGGYDRHHTDIDEARGFTDWWEGFQRTRAGDFLREHTPLVRALASRERGRRAMALLVLAPFLLCVLLAALFRQPWILVLGVALLAALGAAGALAWSWYSGSPQQAADRFLTDEHLLTRREGMQQLSDRALSHAADHAMPGTRAMLDSGDARRRPISPSLAGVLLGDCHRAHVWLSMERPAYVLSPARGGKTNALVIPLIVEAPGAVVATSSRKDILDATFDLRTGGYATPSRRDFDGSSPHSDGERAYVFDPMGIVGSVRRYSDARIRWDPVPACRDTRKARTLASALVSSANFSGEDATWARIGVDITQALLLAAALDGKGLDDVFLWSQDTQGISRARSILERHEQECPEARAWALPLARLSEDDRRTASNKLLTMSSAFSALSLPQVRAWFRPDPLARRFDMRAFLRSRQTVYLLAELRSVNGQADASTAVFNCMFLDDVRDTAREMAAEAEHGKLEPSVSLILDECANISPWPALPQVFTAGSGDGIFACAVFQSRPQAQDVYRKAEAQMWESGQKVVLGGLSDSQTLRDISALVGKREVKSVNHSYRGGFWLGGRLRDGLGTNEQTQRVATLDEQALREIPQWCALLMSAATPAAAVKLIPWWQRGWQGEADEADGTAQAWSDAPQMTVR